MDGPVNVDGVFGEAIADTIVFQWQTAIFPEHRQPLASRSCPAGRQRKAILDLMWGIVDGEDVIAGRNAVVAGGHAQKSGGDAALEGGIESPGRITKTVFLGPPQPLALEQRLLTELDCGCGAQFL